MHASEYSACICILFTVIYDGHWTDEPITWLGQPFSAKRKMTMMEIFYEIKGKKWKEKKIKKKNDRWQLTTEKKWNELHFLFFLSPGVSWTANERTEWEKVNSTTFEKPRAWCKQSTTCAVPDTRRWRCKDTALNLVMCLHLYVRRSSNYLYYFSCLR